MVHSTGRSPASVLVQKPADSHGNLRVVAQITYRNKVRDFPDSPIKLDVASKPWFHKRF
jgi:hypothetical protein